MNTVNLIGRLTKDIQLNYTQSGLAIATATLAVNRSFKNKNGEREADFIRIKAFKKGAEILAQYTSKGSQIGIEGTIQTGKYENQQGQTVFTTDVIVNNFDFLDNKPSNNSSSSNQQQRVSTYNDEVSQAQRPTVQSQGDSFPINDSDLPF